MNLFVLGLTLLAEPSDALANCDAEQDSAPPSSRISEPSAASSEAIGACAGGRRRDDVSPRRSEKSWIERWAPERNTGEVGVYGGMFAPGRNHELYEDDISQADRGFERYAPAGASVGARAGYYPSRFFGIEAEGGLMPTATANRERANLWTARGSAVGQLGLWSVTPFVTVGAGALGVSSDRSAVGNDIDGALHVGGGVKVFTSRYAQVRVDVRDVIGARRGVGSGINHNVEATLGVAITLGRAKDAPVRTAPPAAPADTDADGFIDREDACVTEAGVAPDGCPVRDEDGDGFTDREDACVAEAGVAPDGCPIRDRDADGISDSDDACVDEPETRNAFEDGDGCPDELPAEVKAFDGVLEGIIFGLGDATIDPGSTSTLDAAIDVLREYPELRIAIVGHTDSTGVDARNRILSQRRAEAVEAYLVAAGIADERIETRGAGADEPIADNGDALGRAKNRRIEFELLDAN